jgi:probable HAF family extracellular repeat protein
MVIWLCVAGVKCAMAQSFLVTDVGAPGAPGSSSEAHGINGKGFVAGTWWPAKSVKGNQYAFLNTNRVNVNLGVLKPGNYDYSIAYAVNDAGQAVGQSTVGGYPYHAFLAVNGTMTDLDAADSDWSCAYAINQQGQIAGEMTLADGEIHAFLETNGVMMDLGTLPGGDYSSARDINDSGVIVGEASQFMNGTTNVYAFIYSNGVMSNLGSLGGNYSSALAINNAGQIVGESYTVDGDTHAFLISGGVMSDLGTFGGSGSSAAAINNAGKVVGYALTTNQAAHAFLFDGSPLVDLNNAFAPAGWTNVFLTLAYAINDCGQIAGAVNYVSKGLTNYQAFLLTPPVTLAATIPSTGGRFGLTVRGAAGQKVVLQRSADLVNWIAVSTNSLTNHALNWTDHASQPAPNGYYRALMLP